MMTSFRLLSFEMASFMHKCNVLFIKWQVCLKDQLFRYRYFDSRYLCNVHSYIFQYISAYIHPIVSGISFITLRQDITFDIHTRYNTYICTMKTLFDKYISFTISKYPHQNCVYLNNFSRYW